MSPTSRSHIPGLSTSGSRMRQPLPEGRTESKTALSSYPYQGTSHMAHETSTRCRWCEQYEARFVEQTACRITRTELRRGTRREHRSEAMVRGRVTCPAAAYRDLHPAPFPSSRSVAPTGAATSTAVDGKGAKRPQRDLAVIRRTAYHIRPSIRRPLVTPFVTR